MIENNLRKDIAKAYAQLKQQGITPSQRNIREIIGCGSFQTIGPILKEIREQDSHDPFSIADLPLPDALKLEWVELLKKTITYMKENSTDIP